NGVGLCANARRQKRFWNAFDEWRAGFCGRRQRRVHCARRQDWQTTVAFPGQPIFPRVANDVYGGRETIRFDCRLGGVPHLRSTMKLLAPFLALSPMSVAPS